MISSRRKEEKKMEEVHKMWKLLIWSNRLTAPSGGGVGGGERLKPWILAYFYKLE